MNLIKISQTQIDQENVQTVNARELHAFLDVKTRFNDWIDRRIKEYEFQDGQDFYSELSKTSNGGRPSRDYHISLDMAKELSMVENNEKGREARRYFIECEKKAKQAPAIDFENPAQLRAILMDYTDRLINAEQEIKELTPKADALDRIALSDGSMCITNAAKDLQMRPKDLFAWLQAHRWIYKRTGSASYTAYQDKIQRGLLEHKVTEVSRSDGSSKITEQVRVTSKGIAKLATETTKQCQ